MTGQGHILQRSEEIDTLLTQYYTILHYIPGLNVCCTLFPILILVCVGGVNNICKTIFPSIHTTDGHYMPFG